MTAYDANGSTVTPGDDEVPCTVRRSTPPGRPVVIPIRDSPTTPGLDHTRQRRPRLTTYDWLGRTTSTTDQRGVVHDYTFDSAGTSAAGRYGRLGRNPLRKRRGHQRPSHRHDL